MLLNFLYSHTANSADFQLRVKWEPKMVILWDVRGHDPLTISAWYPRLTSHASHQQNRVTSHSAIFDWASQERRHLARITPQAEKPYETPFERVHGVNGHGHANGHE